MVNMSLMYFKFARDGLDVWCDFTAVINGIRYHMPFTLGEERSKWVERTFEAIDFDKGCVVKNGLKRLPGGDYKKGNIIVDGLEFDLFVFRMIKFLKYCPHFDFSKMIGERYFVEIHPFEADGANMIARFIKTIAQKDQFL